jgi:hypothetical protein
MLSVVRLPRIFARLLVQSCFVDLAANIKFDFALFEFFKFADLHFTGTEQLAFTGQPP